MSERALIVGITGASGTLIGVRLLEALRASGVPTRLIMTRPAEITLAHETDLKLKAIRELADVVHAIDDVGAACASGSFPARGMIIAPCSMKSLAEIATGVTSNLLTRTADVMLKERRRLVVVPRETPLHSGHLRNMLTVSELGAIVAPPVPAFYTRPETIEDVVGQTVGRLLDLFDLDVSAVRRWGVDLGPGVRRAG
ncbi:MAG: UbiX family flavin prenyltransferase [Geminicoccaceae bacterium]|nr:UbiX family flavin prenyltransferase [Geminicoccaceae bacterium]